MPLPPVRSGHGDRSERRPLREAAARAAQIIDSTLINKHHGEALPLACPRLAHHRSPRIQDLMSWPDGLPETPKASLAP